MALKYRTHYHKASHLLVFRYLFYPEMPYGHYHLISNARRRREKATRKVRFPKSAAGDVIGTAWRTEMTWSQR